MNELNQHAEILKSQISLGEAVERLKNNRDYQMVFKKYLFGEYLNSLSLSLSVFSKDSKEYQEILREIDSLSYLNNRLLNITNEGNNAKFTLRETLAMLDEENNGTE